MSDFRKLAHLEEQLGDERWQTLLDPENTGKVKAFCDELLKATTLPTQMTVGGRTYDLLGFLRGDEKSVSGEVMVTRAKEMRANLGEKDGQHILKHQGDIPAQLRGKVVFVFTDWRLPDDSVRIAYVCWLGGRWVQRWLWLGLDFCGRCVLPRGK